MIGAGTPGRGLAELVRERVRGAREASRLLRRAPTAVREAALRAMAGALRARAAGILAGNVRDMERAQACAKGAAFLDRLRLDPGRVEAMASSLEEVARLPDPAGEVVRSWNRPNGLQISEVRVPIGVVAIIYEARPNVTSETASLCIRSGNACVLRGGSDALETNRAIAAALVAGAEEAGIPGGAVTFLDFPEREAVDVLLSFDDLVDLVIPRGGEGLVRTVVEKSRIPVVKQYKGVCHTYVDLSADHAMAIAIALNAKVQRPAVCNAMETLLVHAEEAPVFLPEVSRALRERGVELRGCRRSREIVPDMKEATEEDWYAEYLDLILAVRVVADVDEAMDHIARYGSDHSETIVTQDITRAGRFLAEVDSACVYVNASTRFTDGQQFGFGAEVGISTGKIHSRGPMGLADLTTRKYVIRGTGQTRP